MIWIKQKLFQVATQGTVKSNVVEGAFLPFQRLPGRRIIESTKEPLDGRSDTSELMRNPIISPLIDSTSPFSKSLSRVINRSGLTQYFFIGMEDTSRKRARFSSTATDSNSIGYLSPLHVVLFRLRMYVPIYQNSSCSSLTSRSSCRSVSYSLSLFGEFQERRLSFG